MSCPGAEEVIPSFRERSAICPRPYVWPTIEWILFWIWKKRSGSEQSHLKSKIQFNESVKNQITNLGRAADPPSQRTVVTSVNLADSGPVRSIADSVQDEPVLKAGNEMKA